MITVQETAQSCLSATPFTERAGGLGYTMWGSVASPLLVWLTWSYERILHSSFDRFAKCGRRHQSCNSLLLMCFSGVRPPALVIVIYLVWKVLFFETGTVSVKHQSKPYSNSKKDNLYTGFSETFNHAIEKPFIMSACQSGNRQVLSNYGCSPISVFLEEAPLNAWDLSRDLYSS